MNIKPDQKSAVIVAVIAIVVLGGITIFSHPQVRYQDTTDYAKLKQQEQAQAQAYDRYLQSLNPDPQASKELLQQLVSADDIRKQVEAELNIRQAVVMPVIGDSQLSITQSTGRQAAINYFVAVGKAVNNYETASRDVSKNLFSSDKDPGPVAALGLQTDNLIDQLRHVPVPADLVKFQKAQIASFQAYRDLIGQAKDYSLNGSTEPWPGIYRDYEISNAQVAILDNEFAAADRKYQLSALPLPVAGSGVGTSHGFARVAQAQFGGQVVIVGNIPDAIKDGIKQGLASAFASFATKFLDKLITQIENNYRIANFLYYSDALVTGQYANDYLKKYVQDPLDQQIVKRFIPQFGCGASQQDLQVILQAKAQQYLGYDPAAVSPSDPDFYAKMAKAGDFFASPLGWELYYKDVADRTQAASQTAVNQELTSSGLKSARDLVTNQIHASLSSINNAESAAYVAILNLGVANVENIVSRLVSSITTNFFNKFVFNGAVVFKEQSTCIPVPQLTPIIPVSATVYQDPGH